MSKEPYVYETSSVEVVAGAHAGARGHVLYADLTGPRIIYAVQLDSGETVGVAPEQVRAVARALGIEPKQIAEATK